MSDKTLLLFTDIIHIINLKSIRKCAIDTILIKQYKRKLKDRPWHIYECFRPISSQRMGFSLNV